MTRTSPSASRLPAGRQNSPLASPLSALSVAVALALGLAATDADALALGRLNVQSALGEPLRAEIEVTEIGPGEADGLRVNLAPRAAFQAAGVSYNDALGNVQTALQRRADGRYVVRLTGSRPMNEPFVDVLLEANWATGRIVRDYTLLLDPPSSVRQAAAAPIAPTAPQIVVSPQPRVAVAPQPAPSVARARAAQPPVPVTAQAPAPVPAPVRADEGAGGQQVTVQRGDMASRVAATYKPADVSLDQMLVALLRANPDAFIGGNINRMKAGAVLRIPSASEAAATPPTQARRTVTAQSRDFSQYRQRLAENAPTSQVAAADRQASGRVDANVQDRSANAASPDRLTIAQGGTARTEERIAQTRQAQETAARAAELQRNIEELNRLQNGGASVPAASAPAAATPAATAPAPAAAPAAAAPAAGPAPAPAPAATPAAPAASAPGPTVQASPPVAAPAADAPAPAAAPPATAAPAEATPPAAAPAPRPRPRPAPPPPPEPSLMDQLMENPIIPAGGAIALLLLGFLAYRMRGRKKGTDAGDSVFIESKLPKDSFFGATGGESVDTSSRNSSVASSLSYSPSQLDAGDVDPVAEADVYLAYGRDLQAEEILREALRTTPERLAIHLKLLEIHAKRRDLRAFEMLANEVRGLTHGSGADWSRVIGMGHELDPGNPLYQGSAAVLDTEKTVPLTAPVGMAAAAAMAATVAPPPPPTEPPQPFVPSVAPLDFDLDLSKPAPLSVKPAAAVAPPPATMAPVAVVPPSFELYEPPRATPPAGDTYMPTARSPLLDNDPLDNDFETAPGELDALSRLDNLDTRPGEDRTHDPSATMHAGLPGDSGFIEFDMTALSGLREGGDTRPNPLESTPGVDTQETMPSAPGGESPQAIKLSLARELHALGDAEGARSLLEEVVGESSGDMRAQAQQLLNELR